MMDVSLLKDPVFMMIGISNIFGMAGLYVPFVYLVDAAVLDVSLRKIILDSPISNFLHTLKIRIITYNFNIKKKISENKNFLSS